MNTEDNRIVPNKDVDAGLEQETNLATMPWEDFEHLVRQLFEWGFAKDGIVDVVVTRASRDRGVDAIMFDPGPVRGGKYILRAKRYTRTVDVVAVRDLYGTVVSEGANRSGR
jgi:restriction system protein